MNEWIGKPKESGWLDKKEPLPAPPLKTLDEIGGNRQKKSETPELMPVAPPMEPMEVIPYDKVSTDLENASSDVLGSYSRLERASVNLSKIPIVVSGDGPKGKLLLDKTAGFRNRVEGICVNLKRISEEIAEYKNSLPKEDAAKT
jgi:hypothetical protein